MPSHHRDDEEPEYTGYDEHDDDAFDHDPPPKIDGHCVDLDQHLGTDTKGGWREWYFIVTIPNEWERSR